MDVNIETAMQLKVQGCNLKDRGVGYIAPLSYKKQGWRKIDTPVLIVTEVGRINNNSEMRTLGGL